MAHFISPEDCRLLSSVTIENAEINFRNFEGIEGDMNRAGDRNFAVFMDPELGTKLDADGWNVRYTKIREEGDIPVPYMKVKVKFGDYPPQITLISSEGRTILSEDEVHILDIINIKTVDMVITPYCWTMNNTSGVTAYLRKMFITMDEDALDLKYAE